MTLAKKPKPKRLSSSEPYFDFDFNELIGAIGGATILADKLKAAGYGTPNIKTIYQWKWRNSVPAKWVPYVLAVAHKDGIIDITEDMPRLPF